MIIMMLPIIMIVNSIICINKGYGGHRICRCLCSINRERHTVTRLRGHVRRFRASERVMHHLQILKELNAIKDLNNIIDMQFNSKIKIKNDYRECGPRSERKSRQQGYC